jgi:tyrosyl-tRNA synthetase
MKMSKSLGNYIAVDEPPNDIYGKVMSIPDELMIDYFELLTDVSDDEIAGFRKDIDNNSVNPIVLKKRLAHELVAQFHEKKAANEAQAHFERVVQRREMPEEIPGVCIEIGSGTIPICSLCVETGLAKSNSEAKRLLSQGAIQIDGERVNTDTVCIKDGSVIKVGKRRFVKIVDADKRS